MLHAPELSKAEIEIGTTRGWKDTSDFLWVTGLWTGSDVKR